METLDVARCHEQSLISLGSATGSCNTTPLVFERATVFFAAAVVPIEQTHRAARKGNASVSRLTQTLRRRTVESSLSTRRWKRSIILRRDAEAAVQKSGERHIRLLARAKRLQGELRHLTRTCLRAQEQDRKRVSRQLNDNVAQTLLAINLRLFLLKTSFRASTKNLAKEIACTQRVVKQFIRTVEGFVHEFGIQH